MTITINKSQRGRPTAFSIRALKAIEKQTTDKDELISIASIKLLQRVNTGSIIAIKQL